MQKEDSRKDVAHTNKRQRIIYPGMEGLINKRKMISSHLYHFGKEKFLCSIRIQIFRSFDIGWRCCFPERMSQMCSILMLRGVRLCV